MLAVLVAVSHSFIIERSIFILFFLTSRFEFKFEMEQNYRIVIIGAGIAGLSCAKYLIENDINDFVIIEAHNRIGGRCQTIQLCKYFIH
jgi:ribulose 1,5-bisphosphate synthetase/thiazole synthase